MTTHTQSHTGRIYVACLASYNAGILHGEWIEVTEFADDLKARVQAMLDRSLEPYVEEWAIHDYEGFDRLSEYESLDAIAERVGHWETYGQEEVEAYVGYFGEFDADRFEERYAGGCLDYLSDRRNLACEQFDELMLCDHTEDQKTTFWSHADEDSILRWFEDWNVFVEDKTRTHMCERWCYIFRTDI